MKVLTLKQPWASLLVDTFNGSGIPPKTWETRSWVPGKNVLPILRTQGFLIHASAKRPGNFERCSAPWSSYYQSDHPIPLGCIIGYASIGVILTTHQWMLEVRKTERDRDNYFLGDYSAGRFAWEVKGAIKFRNPIRVTGMLGFWNYNELIPELAIPEPEDFDRDEDGEFTPCDQCDGHDACEDFGCGIGLGLGKMVKKSFELGGDEWR